MDKTNFILYKDSKEIINILSDEQAGKLFKAIFQYVEDRTELDTKDGMLKIAFTQIKITLERDLIKYKSTVKRNIENGKKGGRPKNKATKTQPVKNNPNGLNENPKEPKKADSDNGSVIDNDIVIDNVKEINKKSDLEIAINDFVKFRKTIKKPMNEKALTLFNNKLNQLANDDETKIKIIEQSILNGWAGIFELNRNNGYGKKQSNKIEPSQAMKERYGEA